MSVKNRKMNKINVRRKKGKAELEPRVVIGAGGDFLSGGGCIRGYQDGTEPEIEVSGGGSSTVSKAAD